MFDLKEMWKQLVLYPLLAILGVSLFLGSYAYFAYRFFTCQC